MPPRPRPRPRPVDKAVVPSSPISDRFDAFSKKKVLNDDDDDSFFIRNQGRSLKEVEERAAKAAKAASIAVEELSSDSDEDDDTHTASEEDGTPRPRQRSRKTGAGRTTDASGWIRQNTVAELLRGGRSEKADVIDLELDNDDFQPGPSKLQLKRARSRSLTPPPELTEQEILRTKIAIRRVLESEAPAPARHVPVDEMEDDDLDPVEKPIDPSLRHIMERVGNRNLNKSLLESDQASTSSVTIRVKWIYPLDVHQPPKQWTFNIKKTDSLRQIAERISQEMRVLPQELRLLHQGKHVYTTICPQGLGPWNEFDLDACLKLTYVEMNRHFGTPPPQRPDETGSSERADSPTSEASTDDSEGKFKLIVRAASLSIPLSVRPTTTCGKIVKAFLTIMAKEKGLTIPLKKTNQVRLYVDGEKQDPNTPISDCDLEDGDLVEVIGL